MSGGDWGVGILEEGREKILEWREKRLKKQANQSSFPGFSVYLCNLNILWSFMHNFNYMVLMHMVLAVVAVYISKKFDLVFNIQIALLVSPIVFPLAFAINADFHRRDTVLEKISHFESSGMVLYMCLREWRKDTGLKHEWINSIHDKLKSLLFLLREYLFTDEGENREYIMRAVYEDFSDVSQMIEQLRTSRLPTNGPLVSRAIHLLSLMCLSFEQLRVVKEYRSPRSIRAFNKVLIMLLPIILSPYFVSVSKNDKGETINEWAPYFLSVVVAFVFSALQGVQDKLDDPFDGMGEDDIKLNAIDDWTFKSFGATVRRFNVGRFNVSIRKKASGLAQKMSIKKKLSSFSTSNNSNNGTKRLSRNPSQMSSEQNTHTQNSHPYHDALKNMKSNTCIKTRGGSRHTQHSIFEGDLDVFDGFNSLKPMDDNNPLIDDEMTPKSRTVSFGEYPETYEKRRNASVYSKKSIHSSPAEVSFSSPEVIATVDEEIENSHDNTGSSVVHLLDSVNDGVCSTSSGAEKFHIKSLLCMLHDKTKNEYKTIGNKSDHRDGESAYIIEKQHLNNIKKGFVVIPIEEESDVYIDEVEENGCPTTYVVDNNIEMCEVNVQDENTVLPNEEKDRSSNISVICTQPHPKKRKLPVSCCMSHENHPDKQLLVSTFENKNDFSHKETSDLSEDGLLSTVIDMSAITATPHAANDSSSLVNGKYMLARRDTDLTQSKDTHNRLP